MSRLMLKLCVAFAICLATAAVGFAQRQPAGAGAGAGAPGTASPDKTRKARATFEVYKDKLGEYRWRLRATNTQVIAMSTQGYSDKRSCMNAIESVKRDVVDALVEEKENLVKSAPGKADGSGAESGTGSDADAGTAAKKPAK